MSGGERSAKYADDFVSAQRRFIELVESLNDEQWRAPGRNFPERINDVDESRSVGVIAHHVASSEQFIIDRIYLMLEGKPMPPVDFTESNAKHAAQKSAVTRDEVVALLRANEGRIAPRVRAIPDNQLDVERQTPAGPATVAQRLERVLVGHLTMHQGSIEAALR
ncbi:MAG TPA: DinB family protein [Candidatus Dormibacteraeota bacterium]|nr:DinB family protein [Candidatus Dormibacteraeota bacterium]